MSYSEDLATLYNFTRDAKLSWEEHERAKKAAINLQNLIEGLDNQKG